MPYRHDESRWPLVVCEPSGEALDADVDAYLRAHDGALARRSAHVVIVDARHGKRMSAVHRKRIADWIKAREKELRQYRLGAALVSDSAVVRGLITAIYWVSPPPYAHKSFASMAEAERWARGLLASAAQQPAAGH